MKWRVVVAAAAGAAAVAALAALGVPQAAGAELVAVVLRLFGL